MYEKLQKTQEQVEYKKTWSHKLSKYNGRLCHQKWLRWVDILIISTGLVVLFDNLYSKCLVCTGKCPICFQYIQTPLWICFGTKDVMTHAYKTKTEMYWYKWAFITQCWWIVLCWNLIIHFYIHQLDGDYSVQRIYNSVDVLKYFAAHFKQYCLCEYKIQVITGQLFVFRSVGQWMISLEFRTQKTITADLNVRKWPWRVVINIILALSLWTLHD